MEVHIAEYDPRWPQLFAEEAVRVREALGRQAVVALEHVGSTSVPGLAAKPVIDIQVVVRSLEDAERAVPALEELGYRRRPGLDAKRLYFPRDDAQGRRCFHLHVYGPDHPSREAHLTFRDHMRTHPDEAARYESLKRGLATRHPEDSLAYNDAKTEYIMSILEKVRKETPLPPIMGE